MTKSLFQISREIDPITKFLLQEVCHTSLLFAIPATGEVILAGSQMV